MPFRLDKESLRDALEAIESLLLLRDEVLASRGVLCLLEAEALGHIDLVARLEEQLVLLRHARQVAQTGYVKVRLYHAE